MYNDKSFAERHMFKLIGGFIALFLLIILMPFVILNPTEQAVVFRLGSLDRTLSEGFHFKMPLLEDVVVYPAQQIKIETIAGAASKDLQSVQSTVVVQYSIPFANLESIYRNYRKDYESIVVLPAIQDAVKASTAQFNAEELITQRAAVKEKIALLLRERFAVAGLQLQNVDMSDFAFSPEFDAAVEAKTTAEQLALKAEQDLKRVEFESQQRIAQAEGEAEAIRIQAEAVTSQGGKDYVQLQAIAKWNGQLPNQFIPGQTVPFINVSN